MIDGKKTTEALDEILQSSGARPLDEIMDVYSDKLITSNRPFTLYMREHFKMHGLSQRQIFIAADVDEKTAYKIISGEKHSRNRDLILRICIAAHFDLDEVQKALKLYGMAALYSRLPRDAALIYAIVQKVNDVYEVDRMLKERGMEGLMADADE